MSLPIKRLVFWLIALVGLVKFYLYLFSGAVLWVWAAPWLLWTLLVVWFILLSLLWRCLFDGESWSGLGRWLLVAFLLILIGYATRSWKWTGEWHWRSDTGASESAVLGTTDEGETLIACESNSDSSVTPPPAGITVAMFSAPYEPSATGGSPNYQETTGYNVPTISYSKINNRHEDSEAPYVADEIPEGDVFFVSRGEGGFSTGYDFEMQVCSTDNLMLAKEALGSGSPRSAESSSDVTAIIEYLWHNRRVWEPGEYRAYGYIFDKDNQWKLVAKSAVFTIN